MRKNLCMRMSITALSIITSPWKQPKCLGMSNSRQAGKWENIQEYILESYSIRINVKKITLSTTEQIQTRKTIDALILYNNIKFNTWQSKLNHFGGKCLRWQTVKWDRETALIRVRITIFGGKEGLVFRKGYLGGFWGLATSCFSTWVLVTHVFTLWQFVHVHIYVWCTFPVWYTSQ